MKHVERTGTYRDECIRIIGAGYWRKGRKIYEREKIHR